MVIASRKIGYDEVVSRWCLTHKGSWQAAISFKGCPVPC